VHHPAHRLRGWLPGDRLSADEVGEPVDAEELPIGVAGLRTPSVNSNELNLRRNEQGEIGYGLHPDHWGRGLATRAAHMLVELGFAQHRLHRIFVTCDPRNTASASVLKRLGMTHEGRLREDLLIRDGWRNSDVYSLLIPSGTARNPEADHLSPGPPSMP
jgi:RimJ/RimL family protein N-acetyltransferase